MQVQSKLAIVIPAYKKRFLGQALESITKQTCNDFRVYIGNDASPEDLESVIDQYKSQLNLVYMRFENNLGSENLTKHWDRCIALTSNEPYIWLFSDDDLMSSDAVSEFYSRIELSEDDFDVYRFSLNIIDETGQIKGHFTYPDVQESADFFRCRINESIYSCITQYIFKKEVFLKQNGFVSFPLAWFSDDATILNLSRSKGIRQIKNAIVNWRLAENVNITSSKKYDKQKARAVFEYSRWFHKYLFPCFETKEFMNIKQLFFKKRMLKMKIMDYTKVHGLKTLLIVLGPARALYILAYDLYCRVRQINTIKL